MKDERTAYDKKREARIIHFLAAFKSITLLEELVRREVINEEQKETIRHTAKKLRDEKQQSNEIPD